MDDPDPLLSFILLADLFHPMTLGSLVSFIVLTVLLLLSALISGSEVAYFSLNPSEKEILNLSSTRSHLRVRKLLRTPKSLLATILISNNFINVSIIILSTYTINNVVNFSSIPGWLNLFIQVVGITFIILLFGEVIPKVYATKHALKLAKFMSTPIAVLRKAFKPVSFLLIYSTGIIDKKSKEKRA